MKLSRFKIIFFNWALILVFITLPMPKYSLNTQALMVLFIAWLFVNPWKEKWRLIKERRSSIFVLIFLYLIFLAGMLYTQNLHEGLEQLKDKLPFLLFPFILGSTSLLTVENRYKYLRVFSFSVGLMAIFALCKSFYLHFSGLGDYFTYRKLAETLNKHPTYFSLFCVISISYFLYDLFQLKKTKKVFSIALIVFLLFFIYLLSSRVAIVALMVVALYYIKFWITHKGQKLFLIILALGALTAILLFSNNYVARFESFSENPDQQAQNNQFGTRLVHWKSALQTVDKKQYLWGKGTGDSKQGLYQQYLKNDFKTGYIKKYNAHNQYIEFFMSNGLIGVLAYLLFLGATLIFAVRVNDQFGILVVFLIAIFSITESILERQSGIMLVSLLCSLLLLTNRAILNIKLEEKN